MSSQDSLDRITFSLPHEMNLSLEQLKKELHSTKSDIIKKAIEYFIKQQEEEKLEKAVALMEDEYKNNRELTYLTALDSEDFK
jgi:predicted DNA-binding protein